MYSIMRATSFSVFNCKVFLPSLNKVIYLFYLFNSSRLRPPKHSPQGVSGLDRLGTEIFLALVLSQKLRADELQSHLETELRSHFGTAARGLDLLQVDLASLASTRGFQTWDLEALMMIYSLGRLGSFSLRRATHS